MLKKIICYFIKNIKMILKFTWGSIIVIFGICYIHYNYVNITNDINILDTVIIGSTFIAIFLPFVSEISFLGVSVKRELENTRNEMKVAFADLRTKIVETTLQNNNQSINLGYLPSSEQMNKINNMLNKTNENKIKDESEYQKEETKDEFNASDDIIYLFKVRYKLEKYVDKIYYNDNIIDTNFVPLNRKIGILKSKNLISTNTCRYSYQVTNICNRAIHGEIISQEYIDFVKKVIRIIYDELDNTAEHLENKYFVNCPRCKFAGYSKYENYCPNCGFTWDGD